MKKKILSLLLVVSMMLSMVVPGIALENDIVLDCGSEVSVSVTGEKTTVTADIDDENAEINWQFLAVPEAGLWVNIYGENAAECDLTYAKVLNMLDENEEALLRCTAIVDGVQYFSNEVTITIDHTIPEQEEPEIVYPEPIYPEMEEPEEVVPEEEIPEEPVEPEVEEPVVTPTEPEVEEPVVTPTEPEVEEPVVTPTEPEVEEPVVTPTEPEVEEPVVTPTEPEVEEPVVTPTEPEVEEPVVTPTEPEVEEPVVTPTEPEVEEPVVTPTEPEVEETPVVEETRVIEEATPTEPVFSFRNALLGGSKSSLLSGAKLMWAAETDAGNENTYNIVINYLFSGSKIAADPYTATVGIGTTFTATVPHPTIMGYLPYIDEYDETSEVVSLNYGTEQTEDVIINVNYKPTLVNYTVKHLKQNYENSDYTEDTAALEIKQGLTGTTVPDDLAKKYDGFYALLYKPVAIAADGSTEVEIKYDRKYYLMMFDLGGGYGVEPIYAPYGTLIEDVGTPTRAGYTFQGWQLNNVDATIPERMPYENTTYVAKWRAADTAKVTVVFWGENADDEEYSHIKSSEIYVKPGTSFTYDESGSLKCGQETHTHSAACGYACKQEEHSHDAECYDLTCTTEVHTHSNTCIQCGIENHTHSTACYSGVGNQQSITPGFPNNPSEGQVYDGVFRNYIYIKGYWYRYSGSTAGGSIAPTTCGKTEANHTHDDSCIKCGKTEHTHTDYSGSCYTLKCTEVAHIHSDDCGYNCGKTAHTHTSSCYMEGAGLDSNLWKFKSSETVTVAADGSTVVNVYYDRVEKTLTFKYDYRNRTYNKTETITAKWGEDISDEYDVIAEDAGTTFWAAKDSNDGPYTNYFGVMPENSATYYNRGKSGSTGTMTYYGESLDGEYVEMFSVSGVGGYTVTVEDRYKFEGFTYHHGTSTGSSCSGAAFYYTRNSYELTFSDGYNDVKEETVKYEAPLSAYKDYVPAVPSAYEPGSVAFDGWYLNPECSGAEYILNDHTMPADNLLLYAKWTPVNHTVKFYLDRTAMEADTEENHTELATHPAVTVPHGSTVEGGVADPTNGKLTFVGWFYLDENGEEKAFNFDFMPVTKDMNVYGKWSSNVFVDYTVRFVYVDANGNEVAEIAAPIQDNGLAGTTETFDAKANDELYANYQEGYFPLVPSHSMTLSAETANTYTFEYVQKDAVPYTVRYVIKNDDGTLTSLVPDKEVRDNRKAVVTENFVPIPSYMPDAFQKRLVVDGTDGAENVIIFFYEKDEKNAFYKVTHYIEDLDGSWVERGSTEAKGQIGTEYKGEPLTINGFTYSQTQYVVGGEVKKTVPATDFESDPGLALTNQGMEINLYYTRNTYDYTVRYVLDGVEDTNLRKTVENNKFGDVISETYTEIPYYTNIDANKTKSLTISTDESKNVITFYYEEQYVDIKYRPVPLTGGTTTPGSETIKVLSGKASGSVAAPAAGYKFVGWYSDAECQNQNLVSSNATFVPGKATDVDGREYNKATTYYAKFEEETVDIYYQAVCDTASSGFGYLETTQDLNVAKVTGDPGSKVIQADAEKALFNFVGWYSDAACKNLLSTDVEFKPAKQGNPALHVGATYYAKFVEKTVAINYVAVGPDGVTEDFGSVSRDTEEVFIKNGSAQGSTASPASGNKYRFIGWYSDEECTNLLNKEATFVPEKSNDVVVDGIEFDGIYAPATYYAKFDYNLTTLTISKAVNKLDSFSAGNLAANADQTFIFTVEGYGIPAGGMQVVLKAGKSVTIHGVTVGETYTVTEDNGWSWRCTISDNDVEKVLSPTAANNTFAFTNTFTNDKWLNDTYMVTNTWNGSSITKEEED